MKVLDGTKNGDLYEGICKKLADINDVVGNTESLWTFVLAQRSDLEAWQQYFIGDRKWEDVPPVDMWRYPWCDDDIFAMSLRIRDRPGSEKATRIFHYEVGEHREVECTFLIPVDKN